MNKITGIYVIEPIKNIYFKSVIILIGIGSIGYGIYKAFNLTSVTFLDTVIFLFIIDWIILSIMFRHKVVLDFDKHQATFYKFLHKTTIKADDLISWGTHYYPSNYFSSRSPIHRYIKIKLNSGNTFQYSITFFGEKKQVLALFSQVFQKEGKDYGPIKPSIKSRLWLID